MHFVLTKHMYPEFTKCMRLISAKRMNPYRAWCMHLISAKRMRFHPARCMHAMDGIARALFCKTHAGFQSHHMYFQRMQCMRLYFTERMHTEFTKRMRPHPARCMRPFRLDRMRFDAGRRMPFHTCIWRRTGAKDGACNACTGTATHACVFTVPRPIKHVRHANHYLQDSASGASRMLRNTYCKRMPFTNKNACVRTCPEAPSIRLRALRACSGTAGPERVPASRTSRASGAPGSTRQAPAKPKGPDTAPRGPAGHARTAPPGPRLPDAETPPQGRRMAAKPPISN